MKERISIDEQAKETTKAENSDVLVFVIAILVMLGLMIFSIYYPYPNGKSMDFWGFIAFWFREVLLFCFLLFICLVFLVKRIWRNLRNNNQEPKNAP